jgi:hypothetical protein
MRQPVELEFHCGADGGSNPSPCVEFNLEEREVTVAWLIPDQLARVRILPLLPECFQGGVAEPVNALLC